MFRFEKIIVAKSWIGSKFETQHYVGELRPKSSESKKDNSILGLKR